MSLYALNHFNVKFTPDLKWNSYIQSITKDAEKMFSTFYYSKKYLALSVIFYKNQTRLK